MLIHRLPLILALCGTASAADLPTEWIDADTGHRIIRLSREDGTQSLYFNQNAYTADGKKLIVTTAGGGISTINLATREVKPLVAGPVSVLVAGHKSGDVYYTKRQSGGRGGPGIVYATNVDTGATREVVKLPPGRNVSSLNADETLLLGTYVDGATPPPTGTNVPARNPNFGQPDYAATGPDGKPMTYADAKDLRLHNQLMATRAGAPRVLFTVNTKTGELKDILREHVARPSPVFTYRSQPHHVLSRRHLARSGPRLDHPRRWRRPHQDACPNPEHGDRRPRILLLRWRHHLVRPADAARCRFLAGRLQSRHRQTPLVSPGAQ
ncbi:exported hypothetical protein [Candidatus Sulfopaludibacter sp. SbA3]|nr:exported hypothetical protein [Candidatus Sulfopaludibacter sp. SbA3]